MNKDTLKGQWRQLQGEAKRQWGKLTDDELTQIEGSYDNCSERFRSDTATSAIRPSAKWTHG